MKTAIITGASSGLGREVARQLTDVFPDIECCWLIARREDRLEQTARGNGRRRDGVHAAGSLRSGEFFHP